MRHTILLSLPLITVSCLLSVAPPCGARTDCAKPNQKGLIRNPAGLRLLLRTEDGKSTFHLFETIPVELEFSSSRSSTYSIELDERMNFAGQANKFEASPADTVFLTAIGSHSAICCDSRRGYLSPRPTILRRELTDYLRFEQAGTYSVFLITRRVFRGLRRRNGFNPSDLSLTSNVLTLTILPDDPEWDSQKLAEALQRLNDPHVRAEHDAALGHANKLIETAKYFAIANVVGRTEFVRAQKTLNALDTEDATKERVRLMQMESKSDLEMSRKFGTGTYLSQPLLESTTRAGLVVAAMKERAKQPDFGVDYDYVQWWVRFLVQRDHPELFRPLADELGYEKTSHDYMLLNFQAQRDLIAKLETLRAAKTSDAAEITGQTIKVIQSFTGQSR
jgi:hypothetical protein